MSVQFQTYPYKEVAALLPQRLKDKIESKTSQAKANLQKYNVNEGKLTTNKFPLVIALGVIVALGGTFLTLAAHEILPHGINIISNLGVTSQVLGYCIIGVGTLSAIVGAVKSHLTKAQNSKINIYNSGVAGAHYNAEVAEMDNSFRNRLKENEIFIIDDISRSELTIYYRQWDKKDEEAHAHSQCVSYSASSSKKAFEEWIKQHQEFAIKATTIDIEKLRQRIEAFEAKQLNQ